MRHTERPFPTLLRPVMAQTRSQPHLGWLFVTCCLVAVTTVPSKIPDSLPLPRFPPTISIAPPPRRQTPRTMEEGKLQALHDALCRHRGVEGLGLSSAYSWSKSAEPPKQRTDGLPSNALYAPFVKEGAYTTSNNRNHGDGRVIQTNFDDDSDEKRRRRKEQKKAEKKAAKLAAKKAAKLEEKKRLKREEKLKRKLQEEEERSRKKHKVDSSESKSKEKKKKDKPTATKDDVKSTVQPKDETLRSTVGEPTADKSKKKKKKKTSGK